MKTRQTILAALVFGLTGLASAEPVPVSGTEISMFLNGRTADCVKSRDKSTCDTYFADSGAVKRFTPADGKTKTGKWWVEDNKLHVQWTGKKRSMAFDVLDAGNGTWELHKGGRLKAQITGVQAGDQLD